MNLAFNVSSYRGDIPLLRGCLASIKYFAPDAPICIVLDGNVNIKPLEKHYNLHVITRENTINKDLKRLSFGLGVTKMVSLWESPFDYILHVDADAVLWGDIRKSLPSGEWDFIFNEPHEEITPSIQKSQYFDPDKVFRYIEPFPWTGNPYFNSGVFACRVGSLDLDECIKLLEIRKNHGPQAFPLNDQSLLNILVFRALHAGKIKAFSSHLQSCVSVLNRSELEARFRIVEDAPLPWVKPTAIHWAGTKPYKSNMKVFSQPMDFFRKLGMSETKSFLYQSPHYAMRFDEFISRDFPKITLKAKKFLKKLFRLAS